MVLRWITGGVYSTTPITIERRMVIGTRKLGLEAPSGFEPLHRSFAEPAGPTTTTDDQERPATTSDP